MISEGHEIIAFCWIGFVFFMVIAATLLVFGGNK